MFRFPVQFPQLLRLFCLQFRFSLRSRFRLLRRRLLLVRRLVRRLPADSLITPPSWQSSWIIAYALLALLALPVAFTTAQTQSSSSPDQQERLQKDPAPNVTRRKLLDDPFGDDQKWLLAQSVDAANRKLARQLEGQQWDRAVVDTCQLYRLLVQDPRTADSPVLQGKQRKLLSVLKRAQKQLEKQAANRNRQDGRQASTSPSPLDDRGAALIDPLGQRQADTTSDSNQPSAAESHSEKVAQRWMEWEQLEHVSYGWDLAHQMTPGPGQVFSRSGGAVVGEADDLIRLIQTTVTPGVWDVNGGPASIQYYQRVHALVVRAPWTTHRDTNKLIKDLRR